MLRVLSSNKLLFQQFCFKNKQNYLLKNLSLGKLSYSITEKNSKHQENLPKNQQLKKVNNDFEIFYKFPHILLAKVICRLKLYQTGITVFSLPMSIGLSRFDIIPIENAYITFYISVFACGMLYVMGEFFRKFIGFVYFNSKEQTVKISHLTFWGKRNDIVIPLEEIGHITESKGFKHNDLFHRVELLNKKNTYYYLCLKYGNVLNKDRFIHVFGNPYV